jgi:hypothetical protein
MKNLLIVSAVFATSAGCVISCGGKSDNAGGTSPVTASQLISDSQLTAGIVNATHGDALAAASDQGASGARFELLTGDSDNDSTNVTKTCAASADGKSAVVTVSATVNRTRAKTSGGGRVTVSATRTGSSTATRTWSRTDGTTVSCNGAATGANVNFQSPSGLKLDISFERSRNDSQTYTGPKLTRSSSKSFSASGKREVTWSSNDTTSDTTTTYVRNKSVIIKDTTYNLSMTNKDGGNTSSSVTMATADGAPLVVKVVRNKSSHAVESKTFVSGQLVAKKDSDATITTTYNNLKVKFSDSSCSIESGSANVVVTDAAGATLKTMTLGLNSDGDGSLEDSSGSEVEGFSLDPCDSEDVKL